MVKYKVAEPDELKEGERKIVKIREIEIGIFHVDHQLYAWRNVCPHAGAPVCLGPIKGTALPSGVYEYKYGLEQQVLRCPWHGWEFNVKTGEHLADDKVRLKKVELVTDEQGIYALLNR